MKEPIKVWQFDDAPEHLKVGSWDDADWLAVVPEGYENVYIGWLRDGSEFGCCRVREHTHPFKPKNKIYIGYHS